MAIAQVKDGQLVESASQSSLSKAKAGESTGMDKDAFLQLLVAQMKYQDPLEPTSNTEYVSQYAQFSQVEQMQNMSSSMSLQRASGLVGQEVIIGTTGSTGNETTVQGRVDFVSYENNKAFLSIAGALYSMDDLKNVVDQTYLAAYDKAVTFAGKTNQLPSLENLTADDEERILALAEEYGKMSDYEKTFVTSDAASKVQYSLTRLNEILAEKKAKEETTTEPVEA